MTLVKYEDETEAEYQAFVAWCLSEPRQAVAKEHQETAARNDWALRASLVDQAATQKPIEARPPQKAETEATLSRLLMVEAVKYLTRAEQAPGIPTLNPTELLRLASIVLGKGAVPEREHAVTPSSGEVDFSEISDEDLDAVGRVAKLQYKA